jgi:hypothetical protein
MRKWEKPLSNGSVPRTPPADRPCGPGFVVLSREGADATWEATIDRVIFSDMWNFARRAIDHINCTNEVYVLS